MRKGVEEFFECSYKLCVYRLLDPWDGIEDRFELTSFWQ